ncbi:MAG: hypothetical protein IJW25_03080 [Clostridia bacterium]|nr:hypothetical protein [Clostridia bacterium]
MVIKNFLKSDSQSAKTCAKKIKTNKTSNLKETEKLDKIADKILSEHKYAFEVLGNGEI